MRLPASIPSPSQGVWHLGPFPLRAYAFCILAGVVVAAVYAQRRWESVGGGPGQVADMAAWGVPMGVVGGRIYHVITSPDAYFGKGGHLEDIPKVWEGGLGIWGGVLLGAGTGIWVCRRRGWDWRLMMLACAPAIPIAQAIGRLGNYFNQELFGGPTSLPWGLEIDVSHRPADTATQGTYHPTFLYELLWDLGVAGVVAWAATRYRLRGPQAMALYVLLYCTGRLWIEALRVDSAHLILGLRLNVWTSVVGILGSAAFLLLTRRRARAPHPVPVDA
jgi:prolipoprotein diacylglyceryl transferase